MFILWYGGSAFCSQVLAVLKNCETSETNVHKLTIFKNKVSRFRSEIVKL